MSDNPHCWIVRYRSLARHSMGWWSEAGTVPADIGRLKAEIDQFGFIDRKQSSHIGEIIFSPVQLMQQLQSDAANRVSQYYWSSIEDANAWADTWRTNWAFWFKCAKNSSSSAWTLLRMPVSSSDTNDGSGNFRLRVKAFGWSGWRAAWRNSGDWR